MKTTYKYLLLPMNIDEDLGNLCSREVSKLSMLHIKKIYSTKLFTFKAEVVIKLFGLKQQFSYSY